MIVDASTGRVYDGFGDERGAEFRINSNLVIADAGDPGATGYSDNPTDSLPVRYYVWTDHKFKLIYEEACSVRNKLQSEWSDQPPNRSRRGLRCEEVNPAAQSRLRKELVACLRYVLLVWMSTRIPSRWE